MTEDNPLLAPFEDAPAALSIQRGTELRWVLANRAFRRLLGDQPILGQPLAAVLPEWSSMRRIVEEVVATGHPFSAREHRFLIVDPGAGELREAWFDFLCEPLYDAAGRVDGAFSFAVDVSLQVQTRDRLERVVADAQRAVQTRDDFLSIASHELKTPLTALRLQVQALARTLQRGPDAQVTREAMAARVRALDHQVDRLVELVDALLDVTRLTHGAVVVPAAAAVESDLGAIAAVVVERQRASAAAAGSSLSLRAAGAVPGRWDRSRVDQVLTNLVANAIKYGRGKPVVVEVTGVGGPHVTVSDEGIGIAPENHERIFERFERAVPRQHYSGLGLGLWISRRLAEALGGRITVDSELGRGARFTLWLP